MRKTRAAVITSAWAGIFIACIGGMWFWPRWQMETAVRQFLRDPDSARFSQVVLDRNSGKACGYVSGRNGFGGYGDPRHFIYSTGSQTILQPEEGLILSAGDGVKQSQMQMDYFTLALQLCPKVSP